jgi:hypothetical protein
MGLKRGQMFSEGLAVLIQPSESDSRRLALRLIPDKPQQPQPQMLVVLRHRTIAAVAVGGRQGDVQDRRGFFLNIDDQLRLCQLLSQPLILPAQSFHLCVQSRSGCGFASPLVIAQRCQLSSLPLPAPGR